MSSSIHKYFPLHQCIEQSVRNFEKKFSAFEFDDEYVIFIPLDVHGMRIRYALVSRKGSLAFESEFDPNADAIQAALSVPSLSELDLMTYVEMNYEQLLGNIEE